MLPINNCKIGRYVKINLQKITKVNKEYYIRFKDTKFKIVNIDWTFYDDDANEIIGPYLSWEIKITNNDTGFYFYPSYLLAWETNKDKFRKRLLNIIVAKPKKKAQRKSK